MFRFVKRCMFYPVTGAMIGFLFGVTYVIAETVQTNETESF